MVQGIAVLVHLEDIGIVIHLVAIDAEGYEQSDIMLAGESTQRFYLFAVKRTNNQVAVGSMGIGQNAFYVSVFRNVPCPDVCRDAVCLQAVASHQHAAIELHHALAVTILVVQGQHDSDANLPVANVRSLHVGLRRQLWRQGSSRGSGRLGISRRIGNLDVVALFQLIARAVHLRIGIDEFLNGDSIFTGDAKNGLLAFHLVQLFEILHLCNYCLGDEAEHRQEQKIS